MCMNSKKVDLEFNIDAYHKKLLKFNFTSNINRSSQIPDGLEDEMLMPSVICENLRYYMNAYLKSSMVILNIIPDTKYKSLLGECNSVKFIISYDKTNNYVEIKPDPKHNFGLKISLQSMYVDTLAFSYGAILNTVQSYLTVLEKIIKEKSSIISEKEFTFNIDVCGDKVSIKTNDGKVVEHTRNKYSRTSISDCESIIIQSITDKIDNTSDPVVDTDELNKLVDSCNNTEEHDESNDGANEHDENNVDDESVSDIDTDSSENTTVKCDKNNDTYDVIHILYPTDSKIKLYQPIIMTHPTADRDDVHIIPFKLCEHEYEAQQIIDEQMYKFAVSFNAESESKVGFIIKDNSIIRLKDKVQVMKFGIKSIIVDIYGDSI